jgi:cyclomaltodextrinase / maltogenic alpha-amylase / neopullulanase
MIRENWAENAFFYHIYPLGLCSAPAVNDLVTPATPRLFVLHDWLDHLETLGVNAVYLGPVFESSSHGYDTVDYFKIDRRLGTSETLTQLTTALHQRGIRIILDAVFNHVGRDFWAFRDLQNNGQKSAFKDWFHGLDFENSSPYNDPFSYEGWNGHHSLVKLNLHNPEVRQHLLDAVHNWIQVYDIDGLRLDAADCLTLGFLEELAVFSKNQRPDFWLLGEIIHGDYRQWANDKTLDSVTNYECYKGLWSSHNDHNYYEIAFSLQRQFGSQGIYKNLPLYNFADNHDVDRLASTLDNPAHLYPLHCLLFTIPGVPSIYYGSEWGLEGKKKDGNDGPLRPALDISLAAQDSSNPGLASAISQLAAIRKNSDALRHGSYQEIFVSSEQFAFSRQTADEKVIVVINSADQPVTLEIKLSGTRHTHFRDLLNHEKTYSAENDSLLIEIAPCWAAILSAAHIN